jgi:hypothetical protein
MIFDPLINAPGDPWKVKKGCTVCGLPKTLHFYKSHPYSPQYAKATYKLDSMGVNTDALVEGDTFTQRIQAEGRQMFRDWTLLENGNSMKLRVGPDEDYRHDVDLGELRPTGHPPGRAVIELFSGKGLVGQHPDPAKRIYIVQNEDWPSVFATVVGLSAQARKREPLLRVGQRVIVERSMAERIRVYTQLGGNQPAIFQVLHVDDIYAIA